MRIASDSSVLIGGNPKQDPESVKMEASSPADTMADDQKPFSAITDSNKYLAARERSPTVRNWSWSPRLEGSTKIITDWRAAWKHDRDHVLPNVPYEKLVADNSILPTLANETARPTHRIPSPHPIQARNGLELLRQFGFSEGKEGEIIWK